MHALNPALAENSYLASFPHARRIKRHHHFYLGPTNSGKTHQALLALQQAESGVYLAPLRLLAMEIRDRLVAAGVPGACWSGPPAKPDQIHDGAAVTRSWSPGPGRKVPDAAPPSTLNRG